MGPRVTSAIARAAAMLPALLLFVRRSSVADQDLHKTKHAVHEARRLAPVSGERRTHEHCRPVTYVESP